MDRCVLPISGVDGVVQLNSAGRSCLTGGEIDIGGWRPAALWLPVAHMCIGKAVFSLRRRKHCTEAGVMVG